MRRVRKSRAHLNEDTALTDEQEVAVLRFGELAGWRSARTSFTPEQRNELLSLGLFPEQVNQLESNALQSIAWRQVPPPTMAEVRERLVDFAKLLKGAEGLYVTISTSRIGGNQEVLSRLYLAQEALGFDPLEPDQRDKLHDSLATASKIVERALKDLPKIQRRAVWHSTEFVRLIYKALLLGHVEHFRCSGFGDGPPEPEPATPFDIKVTRMRKARIRKNRVIPFGEIAHIVSRASGGWSSDDAIRKYILQEGAKRRKQKDGGK